MTATKTGTSTWTNAKGILSLNIIFTFLVFGHKAITSGKHYWEVIINSINNDRSGMVIGVTSNKTGHNFSQDYAIGMSGGMYRVSGSGTYGNKNDRIGVLLDMTNLSLSFFVNGKNIYTNAKISYGTYYPVVHLYYAGDQVTLNFPNKIPK